MFTELTRESVARAFAEELGRAITSKLDGQATPGPAEGWGDTGWLASMQVGGQAHGTLSVWFEAKGTLELAAAIAASRGVPAAAAAEQAADAIVTALGRELVAEAAAALATRPPFNVMTFGAPVIGHTAAHGVPLTAISVDLAGKGTCRLAVGAEVTIELPPGNERLEAVLDVELPLIVRFGHAVMPLKALAALGPGSMVDLSRPADGPVEMLVGGRVIAYGEVVIVAGNYAVRVTEVTDDAERPQALVEA